MARLNHQTWGEGSPLVLLHGFMGDCSDWVSIADRLGQHHACIALDLPGHGGSKSVQVKTEPAFDEVVELILSTLDNLGIERFHLLGYSLGGRIAAYLAQQTPERLLSLNLESANPAPLDCLRVTTRLAHDRGWHKRMMENSMTGFLDKWYRQDVFADLNEQKRKEMIAARAGNDPKSLAAMYLGTSLAYQQDSRSIERFEFPVRALTGKKDEKYCQLASEWQQQQPSLIHRVIPSAGHNVHRAQPEAFADVLGELMGWRSQDE